MTLMSKLATQALILTLLFSCKSGNGEHNNHAEHKAHHEEQKKVEKPKVSPLLDPSQATEKAPEKFVVKLKTNRGDLMIDVTRAWAPLGADRFYNLVKIGFYDNVAFFRVISGFMAQTGINGDPKVSAVWRTAKIKDDKVTQSNLPGYISFASAGPDTRTTQFFINFADNSRLNSMGFAPFGKLQDKSMATFQSIYAGYGEGAPMGSGPAQGRIQQDGNDYLKKDFPKLDYIEKATIVESH